MKKLNYLLPFALLGLTACNSTENKIEEKSVYLSTEQVLLNANNFLESKTEMNQHNDYDNFHVVLCKRDSINDCSYFYAPMVSGDVFTTSVMSNKLYLEKLMKNSPLKDSEVDTYDEGIFITSLISEGEGNTKDVVSGYDDFFTDDYEGMKVYISLNNFEGFNSFETEDVEIQLPQMRKTVDMLHLPEKGKKAFSVNSDYATMVKWN